MIGAREVSGVSGVDGVDGVGGVSGVRGWDSFIEKKPKIS